MDRETPFTASLTYRDPAAAVEWLTKVFGFELTMAIEGPDGDSSQSHYEMSASDGRGRLMLGGEWADWTRSPLSTGQLVTASVHVAISGDVDSHCDRARSAGAEILMGPTDQFYGDRLYRCRDLEGHHWTFSTHVRDVSIEEAQDAIGTKITAIRW